MNYEFPLIRHISDVLPAIEGRDEFIVAERDGYTVINYVVSTGETWKRDGNAELANYYGGYEAWTIRRECRGLIFYPDGRIMSRPFHKFFNLGEKDETLQGAIDFTREHRILTKMDGSMIRPLIVNDTLRLATKMGVTDVAIEAEKLLTSQQKSWLRMAVEQGITPLFEYIAPTNKIVVNYTEPKLVYLGQRNNFTGRYAMNGVPDELFEYVDIHGSIVASKLDDFLAGARAQEGMEGYIVRFADGHMVKVKNEWYVRIHKMLDTVRSDRAIVDLGLNEALDDAVSLIPQDDRDRVWGVFSDFMEGLHKKTLMLIEMQKMIFDTYIQDPAMFEKPVIDKKRLALEFVPTLSDKKLGKFVFSLADGKDPRELLLAAAKSNIGTNTKYEEFRDWLQN